MRTNGGDYPCDNGVAATDRTCLKQWANRNPDTNWTQASPKGVALEYLVDIANAADIDPWFCIPHGADDAYVTAFAQLVLQRLNTQHNVYIELSNELWNFSGDYPQADWAQANGSHAFPTLSADLARTRFVAKRSAEIFHLFEQVFAGQTQRLVKILPGITPIPSLNDQLLLDFADPTVNVHGVSANVLAIAGYFGGEVVDEIAYELATGLRTQYPSVQEILDRGRDAITIDRPDPTAPGETVESLTTMVTANKVVADAHGVPLIAYEGGQALHQNLGEANDPTLGQTAIDANRDAQMYGIYNHLMDTWSTIGTGLFMHYSLANRPTIEWDSYGSLEWADQPVTDAHKYRALVDRVTQP
jgi:hypothetical protein